MANFTITGNVGGTAGSGAQVQLSSDRGDIKQQAICDASGNFTFTVTDQRVYNLTAIPSSSSNVCRVMHSVQVNGANVTGVNFQIYALNSSNTNPSVGVF